MTAERDAYELLQVSRSADWPTVRAAYWKLARRYHPDGTTPDPDRMIEINAAYECLEQQRRSPGADGRRWVPVGPGAPSRAPRGPQDLGPLMRRVVARGHAESPVIDFGQYAGWRIAEVATHDPDYLRFLSRHSSGVRYRAAIEQALGADPDIGRRSALLR